LKPRAVAIRYADSTRPACRTVPSVTARRNWPRLRPAPTRRWKASLRVPASTTRVTATRRTRAHFRGDRARLASAAATDPAALSLHGTVEQAAYLGNGYRYRVRVGRGQVWVDDPAPVAEGSRTHVVVPRDALFFFPT